MQAVAAEFSGCAGYVFSEVSDLKPTSAVGSDSLKNPAHLFNFLT